MAGTPTLADLRDLMTEIEGDMAYMDAATAQENREGIQYVRWLFSEMGVEA